MDLKKVFSKKLKLLRKRHGLTQEALAEIVGVAPRHVSFLETARSFPSCDLIERLSAALDVDYSEFFEDDRNISREVMIDKVFETVKRLDDERLSYLYKSVMELCTLSSHKV